MKKFGFMFVLILISSGVLASDFVECAGKLKARSGADYLYTVELDKLTSTLLWEESVGAKVLVSAEMDCESNRRGDYLCAKQDGARYKQVRITNVGFGEYRAKFRDELSVGGSWAQILWPKFVNCETK